MARGAIPFFAATGLFILIIEIESTCPICRTPFRASQARPKKIRELSERSGISFETQPCPECWGKLHSQRIAFRCVAEHIDKSTKLLAIAVKSNDYGTYADSIAKINRYIEGAEELIGREVKRIAELNEKKNLVIAIRDKAEKALRESPRASYFLRRLQADKYISQIHVRFSVFQRDNFTCRHCGTKANLTVDHIVPVLRGGQDDIENLQTLCKRCNCKKGAR